jgi:hypothetical protein
MSESKDPMIAALLREREGYVAFGKKDRLTAVDAELKRRGYDEPKAEPKERVTRESKQTTADAPAKKTAAEKV